MLMVTLFSLSSFLEIMLSANLVSSSSKKSRSAPS
jgi:hypothetical protein